MSDYIKARDQIRLADEIVKGKLTARQVRKRLQSMREAHKEPFSPYIPSKKGKPWDVAYLKSLGELITFGGGSEAQFLYMAEVADEVYKSRRLTKNIVCTLTALATLIAIAAVIVKLLGRGN